MLSKVEYATEYENMPQNMLTPERSPSHSHVLYATRSFFSLHIYGSMKNPTPPERNASFVLHSTRVYSHIRQHEGIHCGEKPFGCAVCDQRFYRLLNLFETTSISATEKRASLAQFVARTAERNRSVVLFVTKGFIVSSTFSRPRVFPQRKKELHYLSSWQELSNPHICGNMKKSMFEEKVFSVSGAEAQKHGPCLAGQRDWAECVLLRLETLTI
ncbi:unnamed protein product [Cyprideis torosa]|uniref:Uncharacterized protein n=1 Tax=Cyprideis torosa TaxID=163714 RepID=A0A7R8ZTC8_9CRUS|nr:unnamed protein product [Cyprideis torosa]CAG0903725.1 unnamed protein product [Cyprideis torosa]